MSKTKEELNEIRAQMEELKKKFEELTPDEVEKVTGGGDCAFPFAHSVSPVLLGSNGPSEDEKEQAAGMENKANRYFPVYS